MKIRRCPGWLWTALCLAVLGSWAPNLLAQNSLPNAILNAQQELTSQEKATVDNFVDAQVLKLQDSDAQVVAEGRALLAEQFGLSPSPYFLEYYSGAIAQRVTPLLDPNTPLITRLNVAIVSAKLQGNDLIPILQAGAADDSPAVRYWIAKAVGAAAKNSQFDTQPQQQAVLAVLGQRLKIEDSSLVLEQIMVAIAEIDLPNAIQLVLAGLDNQASNHQKNVNARYKPVHNGMQQLYRKLLTQRAGGGNVSNVNANIFELSRIAYIYYALIGQQLEQMQNSPPVDEDLKSDKAVMARLCQDVMTYAVRDVAGQTAPQPVDTNSAAQINASAALWQGILTGPPFNFTAQQLTITPAQP